MSTPFRLGTVSIESGPDAPAVLWGERIFLLSDLYISGKLGKPPKTLLEFLTLGPAAVDMLADTLAATATDSRGFLSSEVNIKTPIANPKKIVLIGANYVDHIEEMKVAKPPAFPYAFLRPQTSLAAHGETIPLPNGPKLIDWEAELGVIIGCTLSPASRAEDLISSIAGYTIVNDVSARDWIATRPLVGIDWIMQKAWDHFQPTGPWITPARFVTDPQSLTIELTVNDVVKQRSSTSKMVFSVEKILRHLSSIMTLESGDIIATGTPAGVGFARNPIETIQSGDRIDVTIESLGTLSNKFI